MCESIDNRGTALITGASSGIGAVYADRLAHRGYDLILVARNRERLEALATRLAMGTGRSVRVIAADLSHRMDLAKVEHVLSTTNAITMLVNNAGLGSTASLLESDIDAMDRMIDLNVTALMRLTHTIAPAFVRRGGGTIVNISSGVALWPELLNGVYGGTKAFVLAFSLSLHKELAERNVRVADAAEALAQHAGRALRHRLQGHASAVIPCEPTGEAPAQGGRVRRSSDRPRPAGRWHAEILPSC
jgi:short-subunit dehydrogenase